MRFRRQPTPRASIRRGSPLRLARLMSSGTYRYPCSSYVHRVGLVWLPTTQQAHELLPVSIYRRPTSSKHEHRGFLQEQSLYLTTDALHTEQLELSEGLFTKNLCVGESIDRDVFYTNKPHRCRFRSRPTRGRPTRVAKGQRRAGRRADRAWWCR